MTPPNYQKPAKSHFAHYVVRMMTKAVASHDIGLDGFALVSMVGHQWDTIRYSRPVSYSNAVLMNLLGINSKNTLYRMERKCIAAGWLKKHSLGKRKNPVYWVDLPDHAKLLPDTVTDEYEGDDGTNNDTQTGLEGPENPIGAAGCTQRGTKTGLEPALKRDSINPLPLPSPSPNFSRQGNDQNSDLRKSDEDLFPESKPPAPTNPLDLVRSKIFWQVNDEDKRAQHEAAILAWIDSDDRTVFFETVAKEHRERRKPVPWWELEVILEELRPQPERDDEPPQPHEVTQAHTIANRIGYEQAMAIIEFPPSAVPDLRTLLHALSNNLPAARLLIEKSA